MKPTSGTEATLAPSPDGPTRVDDTVDAGASDAVAGALRPELVGYTSGALLGQGGMGEIVLAHDRRIGRDVAVKRMRATSPSDEASSRFMREARIQARLEHPAIVPVYELGTASDGSPFFAMKRLAGVTLAEVLAGTAHKLDLKGQLRALVDVCLATEFAHSRGVVHRDLKPTNIMLGDFGEVYVLDWGIARVLAGSDNDAVGLGVSTLDGETQVGAILGTPGYMPPEQLEGGDVGRGADVYAIGAILFEILAGEPLHARTAAMASTLMHPTASPAQRRPDREIAPELDAACVAALAKEPTKRPRARELANLLQRYLDGDRDTERRRALADECLAIARHAVASDDPLRRSEAISSAGRALALDPESKEAGALVGRLMLDVPRVLPGELTLRLQEIELESDVRAASLTFYALVAGILCLAMVWWVDVKSWPWIVAGAATMGALAALCAWMARTRQIRFGLFMFGFAALAIIFSRMFGPFIVVPAMLVLHVAGMISQPGYVDRPWLPIGSCVAALIAPLVLEATGVFGQTWTIAGDRLVIESAIIHINGIGPIIWLVVSNVSFIIINALYTQSHSAARRDASRQLEIYAWHLRHLLPAAAPDPRSSSTALAVRHTPAAR